MNKTELDTHFIDECIHIDKTNDLLLTVTIDNDEKGKYYLETLQSLPYHTQTGYFLNKFRMMYEVYHPAKSIPKELLQDLQVKLEYQKFINNCIVLTYRIAPTSNKGIEAANHLPFILKELSTFGLDMEGKDNEFVLVIGDNHARTTRD